MIQHLSGTIIDIGENSAILDVQGVGYKVSTTSQTLGTIKTGSPASLWTHLSVRETALDLYGFLSRSELTFFELLITISGIGPKTALGILNVASVETLRNAVFTENTAHLIKVSGVGKKNAEKIVLELRGKLNSEAGDGASGRHDDSDAIEALTSLGYNLKDAREALKEISQEVTGTGERVKRALKILST